MDLYEQDVVFVADGDSGNRVIQLPITRIENVEGAIKTVNGVKPDSNGNVNATGLPVGFEYFQTNPNVRSGSLPLTGGTYSRELYADFWSWIQEQSGYLISEAEWQAKASANGGAVPFYSDGDGSTTFRVPALTVWVKGANGDEVVGDYLADQFKSHKHNVSVSLADSGAHTHSASTATSGDHTHNIRAGYPYTDVASGIDIIEYDQYNKDRGYINDALGLNPIIASAGGHTHTVTVNSAGSHNHTVTLTEATQGGSETRPKTIVGLYCVIAFTTASTSGSVNLDSLNQSIINAQTVIEAAAGLIKYESYGSIRDRDSNKPTYGLS